MCDVSSMKFLDDDDYTTPTSVSEPETSDYPTGTSVSSTPEQQSSSDDSAV